MSVQVPRGTHDILPDETPAWQHLERVFAGLAHCYGFQEIRTPMFEDTSLFVRTSGETSDIVTKEMYTFVDRGDRSLTLKPEGTAPAIRAYLQHRLGQPHQVTKLWYLTPVFRYERPQKGRFRQSHQFGLELIGSRSPAADAEIIQLTSRFYDAIGIHDTVVLLNSVGRTATRTAFRSALLEHVKDYLESAPEEVQTRVSKNPLRLVDSKDPAVTALLATGPKITDYLEPESKAYFEELQALLEKAGVRYELSPNIVRGLDYYTDTVFEVHSTLLGAQGALCGGGRYDNLIAELAGPPTPSVGVGIGVERALIVLNSLGKTVQSPDPKAFLVAATADAWPVIAELTTRLRDAGVPASRLLDQGAMSKQLKEADRVGAEFAVLVGTEELEREEVTLRCLATGEQKSVPMSQIVAVLKS